MSTFPRTQDDGVILGHVVIQRPAFSPLCGSAIPQDVILLCLVRDQKVAHIIHFCLPATGPVWEARQCSPCQAGLSGEMEGIRDEELPQGTALLSSDLRKQRRSTRLHVCSGHKYATCMCWALEVCPGWWCPCFRIQVQGEA